MDSPSFADLVASPSYLSKLLWRLLEKAFAPCEASETENPRWLALPGAEPKVLLVSVKK